jgi:hypothetical protein
MRKYSWRKLEKSAGGKWEAVDIFTEKLTAILDRITPVKKFQIRTKYAACVDEGTKIMMQDRDMAQQTASNSGRNDDKKIRNVVTT